MDDIEIFDNYIGQIISGSKFKELFPYASDNLIKLDENNPSENNKEGELIFTDINKFCDLFDDICSEYRDDTIFYYRKVFLEDDCQIYIQEKNFKTNKFILGDRVEISLLDAWNDESFCMRAIGQCPFAIKYIKNPSEAMQLKAVIDDYEAIKYIDDPTEKVKQMVIINEYEDGLKYISEPYEEVKIEAIKKYPYSIWHINNPSEELQLIAVEQDGMLLSNIMDRAESKEDISEDVIVRAVEQNGMSIQYIERPDEELQLKAIKQNSESILYIERPTKKVQLEALKNNISVMRYIYDPCKEAVEYVKNYHEEQEYYKNVEIKFSSYFG